MNIPAQYRRLEGSERYPAPGARLVGPADPNEPLSVTIIVRRRSDAPPLPDLEYWQTTPPQSHTFLSREEFAASYSGAEEDLQRVADFVRSRGLSVEETSIPRRGVVVSGTVAQFNDAFAVELGRYELPDQTYRGREGSIYMPAGLAEIIEGVFGLDNRRMGGHNSGGGGLNPSNLTLPQVAGLYNFPPGNANGQTIGILEMVKVGSGYRPGDIQAFFNSLGAGNASPNSGYVIPVDGTSLVFGGTSAVAPLYAGLIAVINATVGRPTGFLNPTLYALSAVSGVFKDINDRTSNATNGAPGYISSPGWDACTGWGSINGNTLLTALRVVRVRVHIDRILDHVPGTPEEQALVNPYAKVKMGDGPDLTLVQDGDFEGFEKEFTHLLTVPIEIEIWRNTSREVTEHGRVETINGQRFIVFGPHEKYPVPPGWDKLTPTEQAHLTTIIISPTVPPGFVRSLTLTYDLITHQVRGDATGSAGQQIHVPPDPSNPLTPEMWFTISQE